MAAPLTMIFQKSIDQGVVPRAWLVANVTPLFKKGSRVDPANYRPISITSVPCKIMEKLIKDKIMQYLITNKLLSKSQHGFVNRKACVTNLLETMDFLTHSVSLKFPVDVLFLDFAKAFDKVSHRRLMHKLKMYGIEGELLNWINAFLSNRSQRVILGEIASEWEGVTSGVPQGSVLGPTLFIIYINDLPEHISDKSICKMYADDTKILSIVKTTYDKLRLQADMDKIVEWTRTWLMELNVNKCKVMHVNQVKVSQSSYFMNEYDQLGNINRIELETTVSERDLGIQISNDLKFRDQCHVAAAKAYQILGLLEHTFVSREANLWKKLYITYVRPYLEFAITAWCPHQKSDIAVLERVQRRATKIPHEMKKFDYHTRCIKLGITSLRDRQVRGDLIQKFKFENGTDEINWHVKPKSIPPIYSHRTRYHREVNKSCKVRHNFFNNRVVSHWNALPDSAVQVETINSFKAKLDKIN